MKDTAHPASFWGPEAARVAAREDDAAAMAAALATVEEEIAAQARLIDEDCDFDYKTITLNAGTYCRTHRRYHEGY